MGNNEEILQTVRILTADEEFSAEVDGVEVAIGQSNNGGFYIDTFYDDEEGNSHEVLADLQPDLTLQTIEKSINLSEFKPIEITDEIRQEFHKMIMQLLNIAENRKNQ